MACLEPGFYNKFIDEYKQGEYSMFAVDAFSDRQRMCLYRYFTSEARKFSPKAKYYGEKIDELKLTLDEKQAADRLCLDGGKKQSKKSRYNKKSKTNKRQRSRSHKRSRK